MLHQPFLPISYACIRARTSITNLSQSRVQFRSGIGIYCQFQYCHHWNRNGIGIAIIGVGIAFYRIVFGIEIRYDVPRLISGLTQ